MPDKIFPRNLKLVVFDVDGTLYDQSKLRKKMMVALLSYYFLRPWKLKELLIIYYFRKEREKKVGYEGIDLANEQYEWCAKKLNCEIEKIKSIVDKWIFVYPNRYLKNCMYPGVRELFDLLKKHQILRAIYSDYDSEEKMKWMGLDAELLISSTDPEINAMKPQPKALNFIIDKFNLKNKESCVFIGDRKELDGECAKLAGIPFLLIEKKVAKHNFYETLSKTILNAN